MSSRFARFWAASTISSFGTAVTAVAMPVLVVRTLDASSVEVGLVNAAQFVPYAVWGLLAGVYVDRWPRRTVLVWGSVGRAVALGTVPVLWALGVLEIWTLVALLLAFGTFSVFAFAAYQSLLPRLVPPEQLVVANARLDQSDAAAQTLGPALGGGLVALLGAPVATVVDALSYVVDAVLNAGLRVEEPPRADPGARSLRREVGEGLRWTYRHRVLAPLAVSTHVWFVAQAAAFTILSVELLRERSLSPAVFGLVVAAAGVAGLVGTSVAPAVGGRLGSGRAVVLSRVVFPFPWLLVASAPQEPVGVVLVGVALGLHGLAMGVENANDMGLWQRLTPDGLLGRVNATRRSVNRTLGAVGAVLGGLSLTVLDPRLAFVLVAAVFAVAAAVAVLSPLRHTDLRHADR